MLAGLILTQNCFTEQVDIQPVALLPDLGHRLAQLLVPSIDDHMPHHGAHPGPGGGHHHIGQQLPQRGTCLDLRAVEPAKRIRSQLAEFVERLGRGLRVLSADHPVHESDCEVQATGVGEHRGEQLS